MEESMSDLPPLGPRRAGPACLAALLAFALSAGAATAADTATPDSAEKLFRSENEVAMARMMRDMDAAPTGDVDADFVAAMIPHHQGAIDMATALLRHGHNERLRRLAQEIIVEQQQEIAAMRLALGQPLRRPPRPLRPSPRPPRRPPAP